VSYAREAATTKGYEPAVKKVLWYRKRWGVALIILAVVLVIGGVVGGVVGGTHHSHSSPKNNTNASAEQGQSPNSTAQQPVAGGSAAPSTTTPSTAVQASVAPSSASPGTQPIGTRK